MNREREGFPCTLKSTGWTRGRGPHVVSPTILKDQHSHRSRTLPPTQCPDNQVLSLAPSHSRVLSQSWWNNGTIVRKRKSRGVTALREAGGTCMVSLHWGHYTPALSSLSSQRSSWLVCILRRKAMTNLGSVLKSRDVTLLTKVHIIKAVVFPVAMYGCESWTIKKAECQRIDAFELWCWRRLSRVPLDCKEIKLVHPKGNQSWIFIGRLMLKLKL